MKKIVTVIGARPQFIKAALTSRLLRQTHHFSEILIHTGQHYDNNMSNIFFEDLEIPQIDYHLGIGSMSHGKQTGQMMIALEEVFLQEKADLLLIYGDTNSTLAAALAAAKLHLPIAHVEAGLRSYNRKMPEEINRVLADQLSEILFTPTEQAVKNLKLEGYSATSIVEVGDVMYDAALYYADKAKKNSNILQRLHLKKNSYILATIHRPENTDYPERLVTLFQAFRKICALSPIVMPIHPRTKKLIAQFAPDILEKSPIQFIEPVGFLDMIMLESHAALIMTDSGGVQKEAFFYQVPCITLRSETEWVETVLLGWNTLIEPTHVDDMYQGVLSKLGTQGVFHQYPYGQGNATKLIVEHLKQT